MKIRKLSQLCSAFVLTMSSLLSFAIPMAHAAVQTCVWTGTAGDSKFSTATNWTSCAGGVPLTGDIISFGHITSTTNNLVNDLGHALGGVVSQVNASNTNYQIDTISLTAGSVLDVGVSTDCVSYPMYITYSSVTSAGDLTVNTDGHTLYNANVTVNGNLTLKNASGFGAAAFNAGSTVTGNVVIASPSNYQPGSCGSGFGTGKGGAPSGSSLTGFTVHGLQVQKGASTYLADVNFPLTLGGGTGTTSPNVQFFSNVDSSYNPISTTRTVSGAITLLSDAQFYGDDQMTVNLTGAISGAGYTLSADPTSTGVLNFTPSSNNSKTASGLQTNPPTTVTVSNDQSSTFFQVVPNETLFVDGKAGGVSVLKAGTLKGNGVVKGLYANVGSIVAPGHSPGCITSTQGLILAGTYHVDIGGTTACTGYSQIIVTVGTVDVTNATLDAALYNGYIPKVGESYTIVNNVPAGAAVVGTFKGIPEGGSYVSKGVTYTVTYKGGDGNDIVLTVKAVDASILPKKPNTGFELNMANPLVSLVGTSFAALGIVAVAKRSSFAKR